MRDEEPSENKHKAEQCDICIHFMKHKTKFDEARMEYQKARDITPGESIFAVDMQRVILLPKLKTKEHVFISRLVTFNETFASLSPSDPDYTVLWHEAVSGRSAPDVASAYIKIVQLTNSNHIIFWCDNCSGQNKNWSLYTVFAQCVNQPWGPDLIRIKYLEKGHTLNDGG